MHDTARQRSAEAATKTAAAPAATPVIATDATSVQPDRSTPTATPMVFGLHGEVRLEDVPAGAFRESLARLSPAARQNALAQLGRLKVPLNDTASLVADEHGDLFYQCQPVHEDHELASASAAALPESSASVPISSPPALHSRPGSTHVIYLDFNGHDITGTAWNNAIGSPGTANYRPAVTTYAAKPLDLDGSPTTFNDAEVAFITTVWKRVKEDFVGFDVDVTTEEPATFTATTARALITASVDANGVAMPSSTAGGVAYLSRFGSTNYVSTYSPALIYYDNLSRTDTYVAEATSHEVGHNLGLTHDGTATSEYYQGHGWSDTQWAPIMGASYYANVTQWSKGEYYNANNTQDDLAIIAALLNYAPDDRADSSTGATALTLTGNSLAGSGVIGAPGDTDWFAFSATQKGVHFDVQPPRDAGYPYGFNLDVALEIYDSTGTRVASSRVDDGSPAASIEAGIPSGTYYLKVSGTGRDTPLANPPSGYTAYGSLGQYVINGWYYDPIAPTAYQSPASVSANVGQTVYFQYSTSGGSPTPDFRWQRLPAGTSTWQDLSDDTVFTNTGTSTLNVVGVVLTMSGDQFRCRASNLAGTIISQPATLTVSPAVAPQIYNMPPTVAVAYNDSIYITPAITGTSPMIYVWKKDGVILSGETSSSFSKNTATAADAGVYTVTATNQGGTYTSSATTVIVDPPTAPAIYRMPDVVPCTIGNSISLSPSITGTGPLTYVWKKDGVVLSGATSSSFYRWPASAADSGVYTVTATNSWGSATSTAATVTVAPLPPPTVFGLPASLTLAYGNTVSLYPNVYAGNSATYQWNKNGTPISGATSSSYYKSGATPADNGVYTITVTNAAGTVTSSGLTLTVSSAEAPRIYGLPSVQNLEYGSYINVYPSVSGTTPITYAWFKDGVVIAGATSSSFYKSALTSADSGIYTLTATNVAGSATSDPMVVNVRAAIAPTISFSSSTVVTPYGQTLSLSPSIYGTSPMTYQWKRNNVVIPNATSSSYYKSETNFADAGNYTLTVTNAAGSTTSSAVNVIVDSPLAPGIYSLPDSLTVAYGNSVGLSPSITGTGPMTYQWFKDGVALTNAVSSYYSVSSATAATSGTYTLTATNAWGTATSSPVRVTVLPALAPTIVNFPANVTVNYGESLSISSSVTGTSPFSYSWSKDGVDLPAATSSNYGKSNATADDAGTYILTVTNLAGTASRNVTVVVNPGVAPQIAPFDPLRAVAYGDTLSISSSATGSAPLTYVWKKDGTVLPGASSYSFSKSSVTTADAGTYTLTVSNAFGSATSTPMAVSVGAPQAPQIYGLPTTVVRNPGDYLSLSPSIVGTYPLTYRWQKDGVDLSGATSSYFSKSSVTVADDGVYTLIVSNAFGTAVSSPVNVIVNDPNPPAIYNVPSLVTVDYGSSLNIYPTVIGTSPVNCTWKKDGVAIPGATSSSFGRSFATTADSGAYTLTASNSVGTTTSSVVTVVVRAAVLPTFTLQPRPVVAAPSLGAYFTTQATGSPNLTYQWYRDDAPISGANSTTLTLTNLRAADYGQYHCVATNSAGSTASDKVALTADSGLPVLAVSSSGRSTFVIRGDHSLWASGSNSSSQLGDGTTNDRRNFVRIATNVAAVAAGDNHTLFLKADGTLWAMGYNNYGQLGDSTSVTRTQPVQVAGGVLAIAAGTSSSYFVKSDHTLWATGYNGYGQLGDGTTTNRSTPVQVATDVNAVFAGAYHFLFLKSDNTLWAAGSNGYGQFGNGSSTNATTPIQIATNVASAAGGYNFTLFRKNDNTLWGCGDNYNGQLGNDTASTQLTPVQIAPNVTAVSAGSYSAAFLTTDKKLWGMGNNSSGLLGDGTSTTRRTPVNTASNVAQCVMSSSGLYYITTTGTLWAAGDNSYGQWGNGVTRYSTLSPLQLTWISGAAPVITAQPVSQSRTVGAELSLAVSATSDLPLSYQWRRAGDTLPGATSPVLNLGRASLALSGSYDVVVSNSVASVVSDPAQISVDRLPQTIAFSVLPDRYFVTTPLPLSANSSSGLPVTFSVDSGPATIDASSNLVLSGSGQVVVRASQAGDSAFAPAADIVRSFTVLDTFGTWAAAQFTPEQLADATVSGPQADPDGDGLVNLVEYALGLVPLTPDSGSVLAITQDATSWVVTYTRPANRTDLIYTVETSVDLAGWNTNNVTHTRLSTSTDGNTQTWQATLPLAAHPNALFRLKITTAN